MSEGTVFLLGKSPEETERYMAARGFAMRFGAFVHPEDPKRYVFLATPARLRGLKSPKVYVLPGARGRADFPSFEPILIATKAREVYYP